LGNFKNLKEICVETDNGICELLNSGLANIYFVGGGNAFLIEPIGSDESCECRTLAIN